MIKYKPYILIILIMNRLPNNNTNALAVLAMAAMAAGCGYDSDKMDDEMSDVRGEVSELVKKCEDAIKNGAVTTESTANTGHNRFDARTDQVRCLCTKSHRKIVCIVGKDFNKKDPDITAKTDPSMDRAFIKSDNTWVSVGERGDGSFECSKRGKKLPKDVCQRLEAFTTKNLRQVLGAFRIRMFGQ